MAKKYFHNFNGIRFYLASYIIFFHIEEIKSVLKLPTYFHDYKFLNPFATTAITMFFTLSGFLISYFLFIEKEKHPEKKINLKKFYRSRIFRIWPLYFFCIIIYWLWMPHSFLQPLTDSVFFTNVHPVGLELEIPKYVYFGLYMLLLPQLAGAMAHAFGGMAVYAGHFWSIGSEELFYVFWPLFVNKFTNYKKMFKWALFAIYIWYVLVVLLFLFNHFFLHNPYVSGIVLTVVTFLYLTRLYCMLIGCVMAYMYINNHRYLNFFRQKWVVYLSIVVFVIMIVNGIEFPVLVHEIYAFLAAILLLHLTEETSKYKFLDNKVVSYFGSITYGVYLYHIVITLLFIYLAQAMKINNVLYFNVFVYLTSYVFTFLIAHLSYKYFETRFLKFK